MRSVIWGYAFLVLIFGKHTSYVFCCGKKEEKNPDNWCFVAQKEKKAILVIIDSIVLCFLPGCFDLMGKVSWGIQILGFN